MKYLTLLSLFLGLSANADYMSHEQISKAFEQGKVGKAPQMSCKKKTKDCTPLRPKYNKLDEIIPKKDRAKHKKHTHKKDYSTHKAEK